MPNLNLVVDAVAAVIACLDTTSKDAEIARTAKAAVAPDKPHAHHH
jgi:hypothetical protein